MPFTSFVGRRREIAEASRLLETARLLMLTGVGGVGKTRLALEVAAASNGLYAGHVWAVDLGAVREPSAVPGAVAAALKVPDLGVRPVLEQLAGYLARHRALLVLDNCEHLIDACAELCQTLLSAAPELRIMATSRRTLDLTGEHIFAVPPLSSEEAMELLRDRAAAVRPEFQVSDVNRAEVSRLCADLDGLPLAIELAAARLRVLTAEQAADRLEDRFSLLTWGSRTALPRQRTLRALVDWSWELCNPAERLLWRRLSVFAGGFGLEAAEGVCTGDGVAEHEVLDLLNQLVAQSVVLITEAEGLPRYRLLETIRQYGRERLTESGDEERLLRRHRDFFLTLARRVSRDWFGSGQVENLARLRADHPNLMAALDCDTDPRARCALAAALGWHWLAGGFLSEGRRQLDRALASAPEPTPERARALLATAWLAQAQGDLAAADRSLDEADTLGEQLDAPAVRAHAMGFRGLSAHYRGRLAEAAAFYMDATGALTALGHEAGAAGWLIALACIQSHAGDPRAAETSRQYVAVAEVRGEWWGRAQVLRALGFHTWERGDREETKALARAALDSTRGFNDYVSTAMMLELLAWATASGGGHESAARLMGAADALRRDACIAVAECDPRVAEHHARCEEEVIAVMGPTSYAKAFAEGGRHNGPGEAIALALSAESDIGIGRVARADAPCPLTHREREVAGLVADGMSNRQIASALGRSPRTVDRHVENILAKLEFVCRAQVAVWWAQHQLISA